MLSFVGTSPVDLCMFCLLVLVLSMCVCLYVFSLCKWLMFTLTPMATACASSPIAYTSFMVEYGLCLYVCTCVLLSEGLVFVVTRKLIFVV